MKLPRKRRNSLTDKDIDRLADQIIRKFGPVTVNRETSLKEWAASKRKTSQEAPPSFEPQGTMP